MMDEVTHPLLRPDKKRVVEAVVFPAADRRAVAQSRGVRSAVAVTGTEAVCFYHAHLKAVAVCDECGCYVCAMCALPVAGRTVCPNCVINPKTVGKVGALAEWRPLWGSRACGLMILGLLFPPTWFVLPLVSLAVLWMVWRCWAFPGSLVRPGRTGLIWAAVLAVPSLAAGLVIWWLMFAEGILYQL
jgi:hypothetical protein